MYLILVAKFVKPNLSHLVVTNACSCAIQDLVHLVQRWSPQLVSVRRRSLFHAGAVPKIGPVSSRVGECCCAGNTSVKILAIKETACHAPESASKNVFVEKRWLNDCVQVQPGSVMWFVEKRYLVGITPVSWFAMVVYVASVLVLEIACAHVEKQSTLCLVQKMCPLAVIAAIRFCSVEYTSAPSAVTEVHVKHADRRLKGNVAVESTPSKYPVISLIYVRPNALKLGTARDISARGSVALETARPVTSNVDVPWDAEIISVLQCAIEEAATLVQ